MLMALCLKKEMRVFYLHQNDKPTDVTSYESDE